MKDYNQAIDSIYLKLGIKEKGRKIRSTINTGTLNRPLNTNYSSVLGSSRETTWSNSAQTNK